jgi:hypothetical protein
MQRDVLRKNWIFIICSDCKKVKKGTRWVRLSKAECLKLNKRIAEDMKNGGDVDFILESCGCR